MKKKGINGYRNIAKRKNTTRESMRKIYKKDLNFCSEDNEGLAEEIVKTSES